MVILCVHIFVCLMNLIFVKQCFARFAASRLKSDVRFCNISSISTDVFKSFTTITQIITKHPVLFGQPKRHLHILNSRVRLFVSVLIIPKRKGRDPRKQRSLILNTELKNITSFGGDSRPPPRQLIVQFFTIKFVALPYPAKVRIFLSGSGAIKSNRLLLPHVPPLQKFIKISRHF